MIIEFEEKERERKIERKDVGEYILVVGQLMRGGIDTTRKGNRQAKEGH